MRECVGRVAAAESAATEIPTGRWGGVCSTAEELFSGNRGGSDVFGDPSGGIGKWVFGDRKSDAARILVGVR